MSGDTQRREQPRERQQRAASRPVRPRPRKWSYVGPVTKYLLFFVNFVCLITGTGMIAMGAYVLSQKQRKTLDIFLFFLDPACDVCLSGCIATFVSFFGCWGALRENTVFLKIYNFFLQVFLAFEVAAAISMFLAFYIPGVSWYVFPTEACRRAIVSYRDDPDMQNLIDTIQEELHCCGYSDHEDGYLDWNANEYFNCSLSNPSSERCSVPFSCCARIKGEPINYQCGYGILIPQTDGSMMPDYTALANINPKGCIKSLGDWLLANSMLVSGVLFGILGPHLVLLFCTSRLMTMIKLQKQRWKIIPAECRVDSTRHQTSAINRH